MEKYEKILNLKIKINIQKPKLIFQNKYLITLLIANIPFIYKTIIINLNVQDILILTSVI